MTTEREAAIEASARLLYAEYASATPATFDDLDLSARRRWKRLAYTTITAYEQVRAKDEALTKSFEKLRTSLNEIVAGISEEGDRTYFGSTNDADMLRDIQQELDAHGWDRFLTKEKARLSADVTARRFNLGDRVTKIKGSSWTGRICGFYSTALTPIGYNVESENEPGSVQIYPEAALASTGGGE